MYYSLLVSTCMHLPVCVHPHLPRTQPFFVSPPWHMRCPQHLAPSHSSPFPTTTTTPSLLAVPASERQMSQQWSMLACAKWSVSSHLLSVLLPTAVHLYPHGPYHKRLWFMRRASLRFKNKSCHAGRYVLLSHKDNKETHKHPAVILTCTMGDPEGSACSACWVFCSYLLAAGVCVMQLYEG